MRIWKHGALSPNFYSATAPKSKCGWNRLRHCRAWCRENESALPKPLLENLRAQFGSASTMSTFPLTGPVGGLTLLRER